MIYKLCNGLIDIDKTSIIHINNNNITSGHSKRLSIDKSRLYINKNLLKNRIARTWNNLDQNVVNAKTLA